MSFGHSDDVQVYNLTDPEENDEKSYSRHDNWYTIKNAGVNPTTRAINLSKKNPNEIVRRVTGDGYSTIRHAEWYYKAGELVCYRREVKNENLTTRNTTYYNWTGDPMIELPTGLPLIKVYEVWYNTITRQPQYVQRISCSSPLVFNLRHVGKSSRQKSQVIVGEFPDGTKQFVVNGEVVESLTEWVGRHNKQMAYQDTLIYAKDAPDNWFSKIEFDMYLFQTNDPFKILNKFEELAIIMSAVATKSKNHQTLMQDYARLLGVAVTDMRRYTEGEADGEVDN